MKQGRDFYRIATERGTGVGLGPRQAAGFFYRRDGGAQPVPYAFLNFALVVVAIQRIQILAKRVQWDVAAGNLFVTQISRNQLREHAVAAGLRVLLAIVVHASRRIFEDVARSPWFARRTTVSPLLQEIELKLQDF